LKEQNERLLAENQRIMSEKAMELERLKQVFDVQGQKDGWELNRLRATKL
jgi:hypothetical protein